MNVTITSKPGARWTEGTTNDGLWFQALAFDEPSSYGINEGRVSKLEIRQLSYTGKPSSGPVLYGYDRGEYADTLSYARVGMLIDDMLDAIDAR